MELFGLIDRADDSPLRTRIESEVTQWLAVNKGETDTTIIQRLADLGVRSPHVLICLAQIKSFHKYKYQVKVETLKHVQALAQKQPLLNQLICDSSYLLAKAAIICEHAPIFLLGQPNAPQQAIDNSLSEFAENYTSKFVNYGVRPNTAPLSTPYRVLRATFWDSELWHPAAYLEKAHQDNLLGVEYYVDFHPFNPNKLLPEDITAAHRSLIREWVEKTGLSLSIHSAIVGPYSTPDHMGKQLFCDPAEIADVQKETVLLARDIGASAVVLHLVDPNRISDLAEIIETAADSHIRVTLENYYYTPKINQTSEPFIAVLQSLVRLLDKRTRDENFGVTFDPGHYNIEGEDAIVAGQRVGKWCRENKVNLTKLHATTNYGSLPCFPPNFSADVHDRVSRAGINNRALIQLLYTMGHTPLITAEQIKPIIIEDIQMVEGALANLPTKDYRAVVADGRAQLREHANAPLIEPTVCQEEAYQFIAGTAGLHGLQAHLVFRRIQHIPQMTSETAKAATMALMGAPLENQIRALALLENMLKTAIEAEGGVSPDTIGRISDRLSNALFAELHREYLEGIFADDFIYSQDEVICTEGSIGEELFLIKEGQAYVCMANQQVGEIEAGEIFGELSLFYGVPRSATVKATADNVRVGMLKKQTLMNALAGKTDSGKTILENFYKVLPERLRNLSIRYVRELRRLQSIDPTYSAPTAAEDVEIPLTLDRAFQGLGIQELATLFAEDRNYAAGEVVFHENTRADGAYFVKSGSVKIVRYDLTPRHVKPFDNIAEQTLKKIYGRDQFYIPERFTQRQSIQLGRLGPGHILGELALIDDSERSATIISEGALLGYLPREKLNQLMQDGTGISYELLLTLCSGMMSRVSQLSQAYMQVLSELRGGEGASERGGG